MAILDGLKKYYKMLPAQLTIVNKMAAQIADMLYKAAIENNSFADNEAFNAGYEHRLEKYIIYYDIGKCDLACSDIKIDRTTTENEMLANRKTMALLNEIFDVSRMTTEDKICKEILYYAIEKNEQYDGLGFPNCLKAKAISPIGRILAVAEFIARKFIDGAMKDDIIKNLKLQIGRKYCPEVVAIAVGVVEELYEQAGAQAGENEAEPLSIQMMYQPVCDAAGNVTREHAGIICLNDPKLGVLKPEFYGPIAERNGRMMTITKYGLEQLFSDMAKSKFAGAEVPRNFSVSVSAECLSKASFLNSVKKMIRDFSVNPQRLTIEIDAAAIDLKNQELLDCLQAYREMGMKIAIDNYGVDDASLSKLQDIEFDVIKIDRSFIEKICNNRKSYEIVKNIVKMAEDLNVAVIAKGVDNPQQKELLLGMACLYMQGRVFGESDYFSI